MHHLKYWRVTHRVSGRAGSQPHNRVTPKPKLFSLKHATSLQNSIPNLRVFISSTQAYHWEFNLIWVLASTSHVPITREDVKGTGGITHRLCPFRGKTKCTRKTHFKRRYKSEWRGVFQKIETYLFKPQKFKDE